MFINNPLIFIFILPNDFKILNRFLKLFDLIMLILILFSCLNLILVLLIVNGSFL